MCKVSKPLISFKSIEITSLQYHGSKKPTTGFNGTFLYFKHTVHFSPISFIKSTSSLSNIPDNFVNFKILFKLAYPNCLFNFSTMLCFSLSVLLPTLSVDNNIICSLYCFHQIHSTPCMIYSWVLNNVHLR